MTTTSRLTGDAARQSDFTGEFETHLTVDGGSLEHVADLKSWAASRNLKCVHIVLARGQFVSQPMITCHGVGSLADQIQSAEVLRHQLNDAGFCVTRVKIEATPWSVGVPQGEAGLPSQCASQYFEHHVKLLLTAEVDLDAVLQIAGQHASHLSRNALRVRDDGRQERFVTQRCFNTGRLAARRVLDALLAALNVATFAVLEVEEEFVVFDNNLAVDAGWLTK